MSSGIGPLLPGGSSPTCRVSRPILAGRGTNLVEGINNRIKVIKRMAYGLRDDHYFFLKIRAAFPGNR